MRFDRDGVAVDACFALQSERDESTHDGTRRVVFAVSDALQFRVQPIRESERDRATVFATVFDFV